MYNMAFSHNLGNFMTYSFMTLGQISTLFLCFVLPKPCVTTLLRMLMRFSLFHQPYQAVNMSAFIVSQCVAITYSMLYHHYVVTTCILSPNMTYLCTVTTSSCACVIFCCLSVLVVQEYLILRALIGDIPLAPSSY